MDLDLPRASPTAELLLRPSSCHDCSPPYSPPDSANFLSPPSPPSPPAASIRAVQWSPPPPSTLPSSATPPPPPLLLLWSRVDGWFCCTIIALLTAVCAAYVEVGAHYFSGFRMGACRGGLFWLDTRYCCGAEVAIDYKHGRCIPPFSAPPTDVVPPPAPPPPPPPLADNNDIIEKNNNIIKENNTIIDQNNNIIEENNNSPSSEPPPPQRRHLSVPPPVLYISPWAPWCDLLQVPSSSGTLRPLLSFLIYFLLSTLLAVCAAFLVTHFSTAAAGSGIPEVKTILGGFVINGVLGVWTLLVKCAGLCLVVGAGMALGKEGPMVHVACCLAEIVSNSLSSRYAEHEARKRELLSAACAAGVSVAFGAPLGGVLFSLEEVSTFFPPRTLWKSFFCAVTASLMLKWLDPRATGNLTMFQMDSVSLAGSWDAVELVPFALLGLMGGLLGAAFIKLNVRWSSHRRSGSAWLAAHPIAEVGVVAALCAAVNYPIPMLRGSAPHLLSNLFSRCGSEYADPFGMCDSLDGNTYRLETMWPLVIVMLIRFVQTVFTFGIGVPAGLFIPCLTIGGLMGRFVGLCMIRLNQLYPLVNSSNAIHPGVYALVGAAAMLGGVTRMTISLVVIMFELTGGLSYVLPFMVAVMVAKWSGDSICDNGIYDCYIRLKGYPYLHQHRQVTFTARACDIMERQLVVLAVDRYPQRAAEMIAFLNRYPPFSGFPVVLSRYDQLLLGYVRSADLRERLAALPADSQLAFDRYLPTVVVEGAVCTDESVCTDECALYGGGAVQQKVAAAAAGVRARVDLSDLVDEHVMQLVPETPLGQVYNIFRQLGLRLCILTRHGRLEGLLTKKQFLAHMDLAHPIDLPHMDLAVVVGARDDGEEGTCLVEMTRRQQHQSTSS
eukprot:GHVS01060858.1.p1 GENE.GHVS01060858.1~~GHVS01060858.1.p1  ORF type:complete len:892 (-),score=227.99 GHVS01060858.1:497-3172(-)